MAVVKKEEEEEDESTERPIVIWCYVKWRFFPQVISAEFREMMKHEKTVTPSFLPSFVPRPIRSDRPKLRSLQSDIFPAEGGRRKAKMGKRGLPTDWVDDGVFRVPT